MECQNRYHTLKRLSMKVEEVREGVRVRGNVSDRVKR
jgi:hypothetical protein